MFTSITNTGAAKIFVEADLAAYHAGDLSAADVLDRFDNIASDLTVARGNMNKMFNAWFKQKETAESLTGEARQWYMLLMIAMCGKYGVTKPQIVQRYYYTSAF